MVREAVATIEASAGSLAQGVLGGPAPAAASGARIRAWTAGRSIARAAQMCIDGMLVAVALWAAYLIRFDGVVPVDYEWQMLLVLPFAVLLYLAANVVSCGYKRVWRFVGLRDALAIANTVIAASVVALAWRVFDTGTFAGTPVPFGVLVIQPVLTFAALVGVRLMRRILYERSAMRVEWPAQPESRRRLLLVGAGEAGLHLLNQLREGDVDVVGLLDDDVALQGRAIGGWSVIGTTRDLERIVTTYCVDEVMLCIPSASTAAVQRLAARCAQLSVATSALPPLREIMSGRRRGTGLRAINSVKMEDLLRRDAIAYPRDLEHLTRSYAGRRVLVTGAGGSIGSELVRQLKEFKPTRLILLDKDENSLYETACEIKEEFAEVVEIVADIRDPFVIGKVFEEQQPEVVFHAAAYKHVPLMERYPAEAILNNVMGTRHLAEASQRFGVKVFVLVSTDKAVNPTSTMGATKRIAEMILQALAANGTKTRFCCVRFGNVLGSRASVVPLFQRQIRQGRNIKVTHPEVRRYFMTIPEAVQLVIQAGSLGERGEIFLLDMGDPVKIVDLARSLIELSGLVPDTDVRIEFTGLRPGEKLNEELLNAGERGVRSTNYSKIFVVVAPSREWPVLAKSVAELERAAHAADAIEIRRLLRDLGIGYHQEGLSSDEIALEQLAR